ncbi:hypothetical protein BBJ28_00023692 [Nothophytophthora sp. Chile5]|nr:hypothetical protein BBJ28_00023692 [Nothophytophthora sp. Chile5]
MGLGRYTATATTYTVAVYYPEASCEGTPYNVFVLENATCVDETCADGYISGTVSTHCVSDYQGDIWTAFGNSSYILMEVFNDTECSTFAYGQGFPASGTCEETPDMMYYAIRARVEADGSATVETFNDVKCTSGDLYSADYIDQQTFESHSCSSSENASVQWYFNEGENATPSPDTPTMYAVTALYLETNCEGTPYYVAAVENADCMVEACTTESPSGMHSTHCTQDYKTDMWNTFASASYLLGVGYNDSDCSMFVSAEGIPVTDGCVETPAYSAPSISAQVENDGSALVQMFGDANCSSYAVTGIINIDQKALESHSCSPGATNTSSFHWYFTQGEHSGSGSSNDTVNAGVKTRTFVSILTGAVVTMLVILGV